MTTNKSRYLLYAGICIALLPVLIFRDYTPSNELRYLSIADEALRSHNFFTFTNHGIPYADKPPLYLWIVMLCRTIAGKHLMWLLSLFSLIPALLTAEVMDRWTRNELKPAPRLSGSIVLLTGGLFLGLAVTLRMDMLMTLFIVLALRSFWRMYTDMTTNRVERWLFPVWVFMAIFSKGPVGILMPLLSTTVFLVISGRIRDFFRYWGWRTWIPLLALCGLWFGAVYAEGGYEYLDNLLFHQTVDRAVKASEHVRPFYYYLITFWYSTAPWSLLVAAALGGMFMPSFSRGSMMCYFLTVSITTFVMLSCSSSKLPVYLVPIFPFLSYATVMYLARVGSTRLLRAGVAIPAGVLVLALPAVLVLSSQPKTAWLFDWWLIVASALLSATGVLVLCLLYCRIGRRDRVDLSLRAFATGMLLAIFTAGWATPQLNASIGYGEICRGARTVARQQGTTNICTWRVKRSENMDVYLGRDVRIIPDDSVPSPQVTRGAVLITKTKHLKALDAARCDTVVGGYAVVSLGNND